MSAMTFGNPWHGTMTPAGLVLADTTLKTSMTGTDTAGAPKTFTYAYVGDAAVGHTYYHKVPGLPTPDTPTNLSGIGGEFKNDVILSGLTRRYSPFVYNGGVAQNEWLHYGDDGRWRKLAITTTTYGPKTQTVEIRRKGLWGDIGGTLPTENVLIATLVLTHTSPVSWVFPLFTPLDVIFDGLSNSEASIKAASRGTGGLITVPARRWAKASAWSSVPETRPQGVATLSPVEALLPMKTARPRTRRSSSTSTVAPVAAR